MKIYGVTKRLQNILGFLDVTKNTKLAFTYNVVKGELSINWVVTVKEGKETHIDVNIITDQQKADIIELIKNTDKYKEVYTRYFN